MPRSYFRLLPDLYERKAFGTENHPPYPPAAITCLVGVFCFGEQQPERGRFKSRRLLMVLLEGPHGVGRGVARQIGFLLEQRDLIESPDGSLYIEGWDELQEGNWQVAERMERYRDRTHGVTATVTESTVTPPSRVEAKAVGRKQKAVSKDGEVTPLECEPALDAYQRLYPNVSQNALKFLDELIGQFGQEWTAEAIGKASLEGRERLLSRAKTVLLLRSRQADRVEAEDERQRNAAKRAAIAQQAAPRELSPEEQVRADAAFVQVREAVSKMGIGVRPPEPLTTLNKDTHLQGSSE